MNKFMLWLKYRSKEVVLTVAGLLVLSLMLTGCSLIRGEPGETRGDRLAAAALVQLTTVEVTISLVDTIVLAARASGKIDEDKLAEYDALAFKVLDAVAHAREAIEAYQSARARGEEAVLYQDKVLNVLTLLLEVEAIRDHVEQGHD